MFYSKTLCLILVSIYYTIPSLGLSVLRNPRAVSPIDGRLYSVDQSRRTLFQSVTWKAATFTALIASTTSAIRPAMAEQQQNKVLVLGGTGLVGSQVCSILSQLSIPYVATSRDGRLGTIPLDFTQDSKTLEQRIQSLANGCTAVISTVGAIGTPTDEVVNAASGLAARAAKAAGVDRFVYISVSPLGKDSTKDLNILQPYMQGKDFSEDTIKAVFPNQYTIIQPTFIYGGDRFNINPPRVNQQYGSIVEYVLSSGLLRALADFAPSGLVRVALLPPVSDTTVAKACVAGALGNVAINTLNTYDEIQAAAQGLKL